MTALGPPYLKDLPLTARQERERDLFMAEIRCGEPRCDNAGLHTDWQVIEDRGGPGERVRCLKCEPTSGGER